MSSFRLNNPIQIKAFHSSNSCDTSNSSRHLDNSGQKRSKISLKLSQIESPSTIQEYAELMKEGYEDNDTIPQYTTDHPIIFPQPLSIPTAIQIKMNIFIEIGPFQNAFTAIINTETDQPLSTLIPLSINQFNNSKCNFNINNANETEQYKLELQKKALSSYSIYCTKKSLKPRLDFPSYDLQTSIGTTRSDNFSLVFSKQCLLMNKIFKQEEKFANRRACVKGCLII